MVEWIVLARLVPIYSERGPVTTSENCSIWVAGGGYTGKCRVEICYHVTKLCGECSLGLL